MQLNRIFNGDKEICFSLLQHAHTLVHTNTHTHTQIISHSNTHTHTHTFTYMHTRRHLHRTEPFLILHGNNNNNNNNSSSSNNNNWMEDQLLAPSNVFQMLMKIKVKTFCLFCCCGVLLLHLCRPWSITTLRIQVSSNFYLIETIVFAIL